MVAQSLMRISAAVVLLTAGLLFAKCSARAASGDSIGDARTIVMSSKPSLRSRNATSASAIACAKTRSSRSAPTAKVSSV